VSDQHGAILEQLGIEHVVYPEKEMGKRVAHLVRGAMQDYLEIGDNFALVKTTAPKSIVGVPLGEAQVRARHGVTVNAFKRSDESWTYATAETVLEAGDTILVGGDPDRVEEFGQLR
jgi:trk system potassium uptake protein TrkA